MASNIRRLVNRVLALTLTNNPNLQAEGSAEKNTGKVEKKLGQIEKVFEK